LLGGKASSWFSGVLHFVALCAGFSHDIWEKWERAEYQDHYGMQAWRKERLGKTTEGMKQNHSRSQGLMPGRILMMRMMMTMMMMMMMMI
jgi:hypothetical protein